MKNLKFLILLIFLILSTNRVLSQKDTHYFHANTVDGIYWKGRMYMCNVSPLSSYFSLSPLGDYKALYDDLPSYHVYTSLPRTADKNYVANWIIINKHLYLFDVGPYITIDSIINVDISRVEKFLNTKFSKDILPVSDKKDKRFKNGVIPAVWFTDTLYIKRFPNEGEDALENEYKNEKFTRLVFDKGRLIEERTVSNMLNGK
jgi:hypothetical protein